MSEKDIDLQRVTAAIDLLSEHFDAVHIFASRHEAETEHGTVSVNWGIGNWYARRGQIADWIVKQDEFTRVSAREERQ